MQKQQPKYTYDQHFSLVTPRENKAELQKVSHVPLHQMIQCDSTGSSHVFNEIFSKELELQYWDGVKFKRKFLYPGTNWGYRGGSLANQKVAEDIIKKVHQLKDQEGYAGMILNLIFGTNDAAQVHNSDDLCIFYARYKKFCLELLKVPKLYLVTCALLPRGKQSGKWEGNNPNMFCPNEAVKFVTEELAKDTRFAGRIKFADINKDVGELEPRFNDKPFFDPNNFAVAVPTIVPIKGMVQERDNVHLTRKGYQTMVRNLLRAINLIPSQDFGFKKPRQNKKLKKK